MTSATWPTGELVHADRHGAVVASKAVGPKLVDAIERLLATEKIVLDGARAPGFDPASSEAACTIIEKARSRPADSALSGLGRIYPEP